MDTQKVVVFGSSGLLGPYVCKAFTDAGMEVVAVGKDNAEIICDLTSPSQTQAFIDKHQPDIVVNLVAMTNVDACEEHPATADIMNRQTAASVASALPEDVYLIHVSTDQVYPDTQGPHSEENIAPVNVYGKSKLKGEEEALKHARTLVLRTNIFGPSLTKGRTSLSDFFVKSLREQAPMKLFTDVLFSPVHMETLSFYMVQCRRRGVTGTFNLASRAGFSKADFATLMAKELGWSLSNSEYVPSSTIADRAHRPKDLRMDVSAIENALGEEMPTLKQEVVNLCQTLQETTRQKTAV